jgi:hypothetical protein
MTTPRIDARTHALPAQTPQIRTTPNQQSAEQSAVGTLERVDTAKRQILVATSGGRLLFQVQSGATIRQGSKTLKQAELASHTGERVKVRYREAGGERKAHWIVLAAPVRRVAAAAGPGD